MFDSLLSIGASLLGSAMQGDAAEDAASAQNQSTAAAIAEQRRQFDLNRADTAPYRSAGKSAVNRLAQLLGLEGSNFDEEGFNNARRLWDAQDAKGDYWQRVGAEPTREMYTTPTGNISDFGSLNKRFTLADFWDDPVTKASFDFGLAEGRKALGNMAGARGTRQSGAQLKALTRFGTDYTGQKAGESYNRFYGDQDRTFNRLSGVAGTGQVGNQMNIGAGTNSANTIGGLLSAQGNARGAAAIAGGNAWSGGLNNIVNNYQQQRMMDLLEGRLKPSSMSSSMPSSISPASWLAFNGGDYGVNF